MTTAREMQERCAQLVDDAAFRARKDFANARAEELIKVTTAIRALPCDESPTDKLLPERIIALWNETRCKYDIAVRSETDAVVWLSDRPMPHDVHDAAFHGTEDQANQFVDRRCAAAIIHLLCPSPTTLSPDAREALTWLAELDGGLPRAPMPVAGSEECYPGPDVPTRVPRAAVRALGREPVDAGTRRQNDDFRKALGALINEHSMENGSHTPDFMLAEYLSGCLAAFDKTVGARERWYGRDGRSGAERGDFGDHKPIGAEAIERLYRPWRTGP